MKLLKHLNRVRGMFRGKIATFEACQSILGTENVISELEMSHLYGNKVSEDSGTVYSQTLLRHCAEQNNAGAEWRLVYKSEQTAWQIRTNTMDEFCPSSSWEKRQSWMDEIPTAGYRLLNFKCVPFEAIDEQEGVFTQFEYIVRPAKIATVAEALIAFRRLRGNRYLSSHFHFSNEVSTSENVSLLGKYDESGMLLYTPMLSQDHLGIVNNVGVIMCLHPRMGFPQPKAPATP